MSRIKAKLRKISDYDSSTFRESSCLLTISAGQETHESERFKATIDLISETFESCVITLHDTLQRYTIALGQKEEPEYFRQISLATGDLWLSNNEKYYKKLTSEPTIVRWDDWLHNKDFEYYKNEILLAIKEDVAYRAIFEKTIDEFLSRFCKRLHNPESFDIGRAQRLCFDYLVEECAVLCIWPKTKCSYELYAGKHNDAMMATRKRFFKPEEQCFVQHIMIGFNHRPDLKPQQFVLQASQGNYLAQAT